MHLLKQTAHALRWAGARLHALWLTLLLAYHEEDLEVRKLALADLEAELLAAPEELRDRQDRIDALRFELHQVRQ